MNHIYHTMAQYPIFLNKHTTDFVASKANPGESIAVTAARLLRDLAASGADAKCSECPEHIGELERKAYVMNECERVYKP